MTIIQWPPPGNMPTSPAPTPKPEPPCGAGTRSRATTDTLIAIVLDKSGSMQSVRAATIAGFNQFKHDQLEVGHAALVSLTLFDDEVNEVCSAVPLRELVDLDGNTYRPDGCTALYDAVGLAITRTDALIATKAVTAERVLVAVITDGEENASSHYDRSAIFDMVHAHEKAGWSFVFLGANMDSYAASRQVGMSGAARTRDWDATPEAMADNMRALSSATARWRSATVCESRDEARPFFAPEDEEPS